MHSGADARLCDCAGCDRECSFYLVREYFLQYARAIYTPRRWVACQLNLFEVFDGKYRIWPLMGVLFYTDIL